MFQMWLKTIEAIAYALSQKNIFLKLFMPTQMRPMLSPAINAQFSIVELIWDEEHLRQMVEERIHWASTSSPFKALFYPPRNSDPAKLMARKALESDAPPRRLIQLGRQLLVENIRLKDKSSKSHKTLLNWAALKTVLKQDNKSD
jgi:hypothetical protein